LTKFTRCENLILDDNELSSHQSYPYLPSVLTLWVNSNQIDNISIFLDKITPFFPNIKELSMLKNSCCPNYFNGGSPSSYKDHRLYVISRIPKLQVLHNEAVTEDERKEAYELYGKLSQTKK